MGKDQSPITLNKYLYANSDAVNNSNPTGMYTLQSIGAASNIRAILSRTSVGSYGPIFSRALWGGVKDTVKGQVSEAAFGIIGETVLRHMIQAVDGTSFTGQSAQSFGSSAHKRLETSIRENEKKLNKYLRKFNARIEVEVFRHKNGKRTKYNGAKREKGSMGLDDSIVSTKTGKTLLSFDLKTGKTGTSKNLS